MLVDEAQIIVFGGHGGSGKVSYRKIARGPDGGNGGKGGDLYFQATTDISALNRYAGKTEFSAPNGEPGGRNRMSGSNASDIVLLASVGTDIIDQTTQEVFRLENRNEKILICLGGLGGKGNAERANARMTTPLKAQPGLPGQRRHLKLILKLIADFGLIGLPNSGKSSLLNALTSANAKVGDYPFTTLEPNLGAFNGKIIADVPGLIAGASGGKGLGIRFLRHIEKVPVLLHCLSCESDNPLRDYKIIRQELKIYNPELLNKKEIILRTKSDICKPKGVKGLSVSILDDASLAALGKLLG